MIIINEFLTSQLWPRNVHLSWDAAINWFRLGGLICSSESFLQLNMCQELQIFAAVYMYWGASCVLLDCVIVTLELLRRWYYCRDRLCCLLLPHSAYCIRQFLVIVLFVGYCFGDIVCIWDRYVYQKGVLLFCYS